MSITNSVSAVQTSTNTSTLVAGSKLNTTRGLSASVTIVNTGDDSIDWVLYGANTSDLSDKVIVKANATVASGASDSYATSLAPFRFYAVFVESTVDNTPGEATVSGIVKG